MNIYPQKKMRVSLVLIFSLIGLLAAVVFTSADGGSDDLAVYLPYVAGGDGTTGGGPLASGGSVEGPGGVGIGAMAGTVSGTIDISIAVIQPPAEPLPAQASQIGETYQIGAGEDFFAPTDAPFILAFPVPPGADTDHLALAVLTSSEYVNDAAEGMSAWTFLEGTFQANRDLFLTTTAGLIQDGQAFALVSHPEFDSSSTAGHAVLARSASLSASAASQFNVKCVHFSSATDCTGTTEMTVEGLLADIYDRIKVDLGFKEPRLRYLNETLNYNPHSLSSLGFTAYIEPHDYGFCASLSAGGYYDSKEGRLVLCLNPAVGLSSDYVHILIHEYFHATQYGYDQPLADRLAKKEAAWVIEGMAKSVEESYFVDEMVRSEIGGWVELHKVDSPLTSTAGDEEYFAQDFWVHYGQTGSTGLSYLKSVLEQGTETADVATALGDGERLPAYWEWAKNQVMEKTVDFGGVLQNPCHIEDQVVGAYEIFDHHYQTNPVHIVTLPPLTTAVIKLTFAHDYDGAFGYVLAINTPKVTEAYQAVEYKFYKQGESGCDSLPDGHSDYPEPDGVTAGEAHYIVISNTDHDDPFTYQIFFELTPFPPA